MLLLHAIPQDVLPVRADPQLDPQMVLTFLVVLLFLILGIIGIFEVRSRALRRARGQEPQDSKWEARLLRQIRELYREGNNSD